MSQIVVDTDVASYIFNWHSSVVRCLRFGSLSNDHELIVEAMGIARNSIELLLRLWEELTDLVIRF